MGGLASLIMHRKPGVPNVALGLQRSHLHTLGATQRWATKCACEFKKAKPRGVCGFVLVIAYADDAVPEVDGRL